MLLVIFLYQYDEYTNTESMCGLHIAFCLLYTHTAVSDHVLNLHSILSLYDA